MGLPKRIPRSRPVSQSAEQDRRVIVNRYQVEKKLGSGNFGTAFLVRDLKSRDPKDEWKVLKEVPVGNLQPDETVDAMHEARLLSKLDNPFIVKFHDSFLDGEFFCIVTEFCEGGDLDDYITKVKKSGQLVGQVQVMDWIVQLLMAVHYMHTQKVLHRDLKTRNIFLKKNVVKVGDFGISRILMGTADMASTFTGTPYYMSPEVIKHEGYNSKSDIWSIGCVLYELCAQKHAFHGESLMGVMYKIVEGAVPALPDGAYSPDVTELLTAMLTKDPSVRPSAAEILRFDYVTRHKEKMRAQVEEQRASRQTTESDAAAAAAVEEEEEQADAFDAPAPARAPTLAAAARRPAGATAAAAGNAARTKNLNPRERMRLRKQQEADRKANLLREEAKRNLQANLDRKAAIRASLQHQGEAPWEKSLADPSQKDAGDAAGSRRPAVHAQVEAPPSPLHSSVAAASHGNLWLSVQEELDDEDAAEQSDAFSSTSAETVIAKPAGTIGSIQRMPPVKLLSGPFDNRPITPLKDKMIYDVKHSSLDFKDGVPDDPKLAETYYSQYEEFDAVSSATSGSDDDESEATLQQTQIDLLGQLEEQLSSSLGDGSITLNDDTMAGAFGPTARSIKIRNLRAECEKKLGAEVFKKVYDYLKAVRYEHDGCLSTCDEDNMMAELAKYVKQRSDCFLVDQLLFLEMQARMDKC